MGENGSFGAAAEALGARAGWNYLFRRARPAETGRLCREEKKFAKRRSAATLEAIFEIWA
jgi:hypothetical protein